MNDNAAGLVDEVIPPLPGSPSRLDPAPSHPVPVFVYTIPYVMAMGVEYSIVVLLLALFCYLLTFYSRIALGRI